MIGIIAPLFVIIHGPATHLLFQSYLDLKRNNRPKDDRPITVRFEVMPSAYPGVTFATDLQITDINWDHALVVNGVSPSAEQLTTVPRYDLKANMQLPDVAITILGGPSQMPVFGVCYPEGHDEPGLGWFNAVD